MEKIISIDGMHCKSCKALLENELIDIKGIVSVEVLLDQANARLNVDHNLESEQIIVDEVLMKIRELGYSAEVKE
ncbi:cation transporter [Candidatus Micrarchaeota archaeon]|nr:cation transporter [Candidatus Micrarchaeota archaeon]MBU1165419.1 cation transporter [Candidatus Micrarchaeota archaeon]MBU1886966.1 cation transporter [Candidatus Micrarchaeota archaeon]